MSTGLAAAPRFNLEESTRSGSRLLILSDKKAGLEAAISPTHGGELTGLRVKLQDKWQELIYRAGDYSSTSGWTGHAPILWPATGRNRTADALPSEGDERCSYSVDGQKYYLPIHGFARERPWTVIEEFADSQQAEAQLTLFDDGLTRAEFPFGFHLAVTYRLTKAGLSTAYRVEASKANRSAMPFSIGNHITFNLPTIDDRKQCRFLTEATIQYEHDPAGLPTDKIRIVDFRSPSLLAAFASNDAVSLGGYVEDPWVRLLYPSGLTVTLSHHADRVPPNPLVRFNLWGSARAGYFSIEPWVGLQNSLNSLKGVIELMPGRSWNWTILTAVSREK